MPDEIDRLIASHDAMSESFDRTLTALAGGSLTLSISFVKDIAPHPTFVWAIRTSWVAMAGSLALILVSYALSIEVHRRLIAAEGRYDALPSWVGWIVRVTNWISGIAFLVGAVFLVLFAFVNVH